MCVYKRYIYLFSIYLSILFDKVVLEKMNKSMCITSPRTKKHTANTTLYTTTEKKYNTFSNSLR